jgi:hypothetical protein
MRAKSSGAHALRIPVSEGYKQKEATVTRLRLLAGALYAANRRSASPSPLRDLLVP